MTVTESIEKTTRLAGRLELGKIHEFTMPACLSEEGQQKVADFLYNSGYCGCHILWEEVEPVWVTKTGAVAKRIAKWYKKNFDLRLPPYVVTEIGNLARAGSDGNTGYLFDFTRTFNWKAGEFGDHHSCFFGGRSAARKVLANAGALAIRFFKKRENESLKGAARAWVYPMVQKGQDVLVLFNGYGHTALTQARILSAWLGLPYKKIELENRGSTGGLVYTNEGRGFLIGPQEVLDQVSHIDMQIPETGDWDDGEGDGGFECEDCNEWFYDAEHYHVNGRIVCEQCYEHYYQCHQCGEDVYEEEIRWCHDNAYCEHCANTYLIICEHCGGYEHVDDATSVDDNYYCVRCTDRYLVNCENCGEYVHADAATEIATHDRYGKYYVTWCDGCAEEQTVRCADCDELVFKNKAVEINGAFYCPSCIDIYCEFCLRLVPEHLMVEHNDAQMCPDCRNKALAEELRLQLPLPIEANLALAA